MNDEVSDDSVLGVCKEVGQELMSAFVSSKKSSKHFDFEKYLYHYKEKLGEYILPDIYIAIENFKNVMATQDAPAVAPVATTTVNTPDPAVALSTDEIECPQLSCKIERKF